MLFLRELISRLNPGSPDSLDRFVVDANTALDFLARFGLDELDLRFWEGLCREAELLVQQMKSLSVLRTRASLPRLREKIVTLQQIAAQARDEYQMSVEALRQQQDKSTTMTTEINNISKKMKSLLKEFTGLRSRKSRLQVEHGKRTQVIERGQHRHQIRHQAMLDAESALAQAVEELHTAEAEYESLAVIVSHLRDLQTRLT